MISSSDETSATSSSFRNNGNKTTATVTLDDNGNGGGGRSAALERAYVHDVYESCDETLGSSVWPRVAQFLAGIDPGSLICDVGCGNGRYLSCNPFVYSIGVDRCMRSTRTAKSKGGEVMLLIAVYDKARFLIYIIPSQVAVCDNLELPFRDDSFDAVLSLAVIHHFATKDRRVNAIKELARILRIGGRVVITVWALEQKHRRFESQDVLIPTSAAQRARNNSDDDDEEDFLPPYHAYTEESTNSSRSAGDGDSSSLSSSSPAGESCYSFVRKTIQKLAGGKRHPWFLDSWNSKEHKNDNSSLDYEEDAKDLPIELRRLEDFEDVGEPLSANSKSRSLGSILNPPPQTIVRSQSSVPSLAAGHDLKSHNHHSSGHAAGKCTVSTNNISEAKRMEETREMTASRPKLVKQKQSLCDEHSFVEHVDEAAAPISSSIDVDDDGPSCDMKAFLRKQSSLNEDILTESRMRGMERNRKRIHKQMSLNEAFLYRSLQVIREGLTTKLKTSTESMERFKNNGIVKMIQNLKMPQTKAANGSRQRDANNDSFEYNCHSSHNATIVTNPSDTASNGGDDPGDNADKPRRRSRESGSDSSKESSLQSDTSIESEDSFASVIYVPRPEQQKPQQQDACTTTAPGSNHTNYNSNNIGAATLSNSKHRYMSSSSAKLNNNYNSLNNSSYHSNTKIMPKVPTSPSPCPTPVQSPAPVITTMNQRPGHHHQHYLAASATIMTPSAANAGQQRSHPNKNYMPIPDHSTRFTFDFDIPDNTTESLLNINNGFKLIHPGEQRESVVDVAQGPDKFSVPPPIPKFNNGKLSTVSSGDSPSLTTSGSNKGGGGGDASAGRISNTCTSSSGKKNQLPILRRSSAAPAVPKLVSLDIFNPETDDVDSDDSSEPSSPDSIDSVIDALKSSALLDKADDEGEPEQGVVEEVEDRRLMMKEETANRTDMDEEMSVNLIVEPDKQSLVEFAKQLSAQLLKELDGAHRGDRTQETHAQQQRIVNDRTNLRNELRSRRLLLANLNKNSSSSSSLKRYHHHHYSSQQLIVEEDDPADILDNVDDLPWSGDDESEPAINQYNNNDDDRPEEVIPLINGNGELGVRMNSQNTGGQMGSNWKSCAATSVSHEFEHNHQLENSDSTISLESPSGGGSVTHHRYYHVFREGELDNLINNHVASLHIVNSYYERASWCVVAEKVQVWTI